MAGSQKSWGQGRKTGKILSCLVGDETGEIRLIGFNAIGDRVRSFLMRDGIIELSDFVCQVAKESGTVPNEWTARVWDIFRAVSTRNRAPP